MSERTEHLGLLKKDPIEDRLDNFNVGEMLNGNWDRIDDFATEINKNALLKDNGVINIGNNIEASLYSNMTILKNVARLSTGSSNGIVKIVLPKGWSGTMIGIKVRGFDYHENKSWSLELSGYTRVVSEDNKYWHSTTAILNGNPEFDSVRFGYDEEVERCIVLLGTELTSWNYSKIWIEEVMVSYQNYTDWEKGWSVEIISDDSMISSVVEPIIQQNFNIINYGNKVQENGNFNVGLKHSNSFVIVNGSGNSTNITVEKENSIPIGSQITILRYSEDDIVFVAGDGVSLISKENNRKIDGRYSAATLVKSSSTVWYIIGALTS
jgi:hypothetical protein